MRTNGNAALSSSCVQYPQGKVARYKHVYLAQTAFCGTGVFTARPVPEDSIVLDVQDPNNLAEAKSYAQMMLLGFTCADIFQVDRDVFIPHKGALIDVTNHSCEPNCGLRIHSSGFDMVALRDIAAGEELTYDYSTHREHPQGEMICLCGTASCRGVVRSFSTLPSALRRRYLALGIVAGFIARGAGRASARR